MWLQNLLIVLLSLLGGIAGNLLAAWLQQDVWKNYFSKPRLVATSVAAILSLLALTLLQDTPLLSSINNTQNNQVVGDNTTIVQGDFVFNSNTASPTPEPTPTLTPTATPTPTPTPTPDIPWTELLFNGGFEDGLQYWQIGAGEWITSIAEARRGSGVIFEQKTESPSEYAWIWQEQSVLEYQESIDAGLCEARVSLWHKNHADNPGDNGRLRVLYIQGETLPDCTDASLCFDSGFKNHQDNYDKVEDRRFIPQGTTAIRLEFWTKRDAGSAMDVAADDAYMDIRCFDD